MWKAAVKKLLARAGYAVVRERGRYSQDGLFSLHNDGFRQDPLFRQAYARGVQASHGVDPGFEWRVHIALWAAAAALRAPGDFVECGVNAGFMSSAIMRRLEWNRQNRRFFLVDTFTGPVLSQFSAQEQARGRRAFAESAIAAGAYVTDLDRVRANFAEWPSAHVTPGVVPEVLPSIPASQVAFLHLDMNCALPEVAALHYFWPRLSSGAVVLLDDYAYLGHQEQYHAIRQAASALGVEPLSLPTGQGVILK